MSPATSASCTTLWTLSSESRRAALTPRIPQAAMIGPRTSFGGYLKIRSVQTFSSYGKKVAIISWAVRTRPSGLRLCSSKARQNLGTAALKSLRALSTTDTSMGSRISALKPTGWYQGGSPAPSAFAKRVCRVLQLRHDRGQEVVQRENGDDAGHDGFGRRLADASRSASRMKAVLATDETQDEAESQAFAHHHLDVAHPHEL